MNHMDQHPDIAGELLAVTRELIALPATENETYQRLLDRRGELIRTLCSGSLDPRDERIGCVAREGVALLAKICSQRDSLRQQAASLDLVGLLCGRIRSTVAKPETESLNVTA